MTIIDIDNRIKSGETVYIPSAYLSALLSEAETHLGEVAWRIQKNGNEVAISKS